MGSSDDRQPRDPLAPHRIEYKPKWERDIDYNPDHRPSSGAMYIEDRNGSAFWVLQVKGLGVICLRALDSRTFAGVSIFTKADIGYSPEL